MLSSFSFFNVAPSRVLFCTTTIKETDYPAGKTETLKELGNAWLLFSSFLCGGWHSLF